jgi:hypothetical protein
MRELELPVTFEQIPVEVTVARVLTRHLLQRPSAPANRTPWRRRAPER